MDLAVGLFTAKRSRCLTYGQSEVTSIRIAVFWVKDEVVTIHAMIAYNGSKDAAPLIHNLCTSWR